MRAFTSSDTAGGGRLEGGEFPSNSDLAVSSWLVNNGPEILEHLLRTSLLQTRVPIILTDDGRKCCGLSAGAAALMVGKEAEFVGRFLEDFLTSSAKTSIVDRWAAFLQNGELNGTMQLVALDGSHRDSSYYIKPNVLPGRHAWVLSSTAVEIGLDLLDVEGRIVTWHRGAERLYGHKSQDVVGQAASILYGGATGSEQLERARTAGYCAFCLP